MRLIANLTEGSGPVNEDGCSVIRQDGEVTAAWIFDGVTGINGRNYMPGSDAAWFVERANQHLGAMARWNRPLPEILRSLATALETDWREASRGLNLPEHFDPPGACLTLVKKYADGWKALRLGDSVIITEDGGITVHPVPPTDLDHLEEMLRQEAKKRRAQGVWDVKTLLQEFHAPLLASRRARNTASGIGILVAGPESLVKPEYLDLGWPETLLMCTDGFYRAVDHYDMHSDESLLITCLVPGGASNVMRGIRAVEASDPDCSRYLRFKPADDATVVVLAA